MATIFRRTRRTPWGRHGISKSLATLPLSNSYSQLLTPTQGQFIETRLLRITIFSNTGKTVQVISFLSAIMKKQGIVTDKNRRRKHVSKLQDLKAWRERKELPPADATWPTCLIIAPSTVVHNWEREFKTVRLNIVSSSSLF